MQSCVPLAAQGNSGGLSVPSAMLAQISRAKGYARESRGERLKELRAAGRCQRVEAGTDMHQRDRRAGPPARWWHAKQVISRWYHPALLHDLAAAAQQPSAKRPCGLARSLHQNAARSCGDARRDKFPALGATPPHNPVPNKVLNTRSDLNLSPFEYHL